MARITLNCACGWTFFIPGTTEGLEVTCPSCSQDVRIPGRRPGKAVPRSPGEIAAEHQRRQEIFKMAVGAAAAVILAGIAVAVWPSAPPPSAPPPIENLGGRPQLPEKKKPEDSKHERIIVEPDRSPSPPPPPPPEPGKVDALRSAALKKVWLTNMSAVVAEIFRLRNMREPYEQLQSDITRYDGEIRRTLAELQKEGETRALAPYLAKGDKIINFNGTDFRTTKPGEAAQLLHNWTIDWVSGPNIDQVGVLRDGKERTIILQFPDNPTEVEQVRRHEALRSEVLPDGHASDRVLLPPDLIASYQTQIDALPRGYVSWIPLADAQRARDLVDRKLGSSDEIEWFQKRLLDEILAAFQREIEGLRRKIRELEPLMKENPAPDAVYLKGGQRLDGKAVEEGPEKVRIKFRSGSRLLGTEEIERIAKGKGVGSEIAGRFEDAKGNCEKLTALLAWCVEKNLVLEKQSAACQILLIDPTVEKARSALGLPRRTVLGSK